MSEKTVKILRGVSKAIQLKKEKKNAAENNALTPTRCQRLNTKANAGSEYA
jgi:hypothetical protein